MKSHRPPLKRCATKDGLGGHGAHGRVDTMAGAALSREASPVGGADESGSGLFVLTSRKYASDLLTRDGSNDRRLEDGRRRMAMQALGYVGLRIGRSRRLAAVRHRPGRAAGGGAQHFAARVPDGRPQAAHRDRPCDGATARASSAGRSRMPRRWTRSRRRLESSGHCMSSPSRKRWPIRRRVARPDFVSAIPPATGSRPFMAPRSTTRRSARAARSPVSAPGRSASAMSC